MKLLLIREASPEVSRRSFLNTAGRAGAAATTGSPGALFKSLSAAGPSSVIKYGIELRDRLNETQKIGLFRFLLDLDHGSLESISRNVRDIRNASFGDYVIKDGIVYPPPTQKGDEMEPFPIDAIFGEIAFTPGGHRHDVIGGLDAKFIPQLELIKPGSINNILNGFIQKHGIGKAAQFIAATETSLGEHPFMLWTEFLKINPALRQFLGIADFKSKGGKIKAIHSLIEKGLLDKNALTRWDYFTDEEYQEEIKKRAKRMEEKKAELQKSQVDSDAKKLNDKLNDYDSASPMHQTFESKLLSALQLI